MGTESSPHKVCRGLIIRFLFFFFICLLYTMDPGYVRPIRGGSAKTGLSALRSRMLAWLPIVFGHCTICSHMFSCCFLLLFFFTFTFQCCGGTLDNVKCLDVCHMCSVDSVQGQGDVEQVGVSVRIFMLMYYMYLTK